MPDTCDISQPVTDTAWVTIMLYDALLTYYAHLDASRKRRTPLAFAPRGRRAGIVEKTTLLLTQEDMTLTPVRERGRQELERALKRAAFTVPYLRASPPAVFQTVVDGLSSPDAVALEARSYKHDVPGQGREDPTTALYALITAITYTTRGQAILDAWVATNLVPAVKAIMHIPASLPVASQARQDMVPPPARKRKAAQMESPGDVSQSTNVPEFDRQSDMDAGSSPADAATRFAPAWTIPLRSPSTATSWPFSTHDSTTWDAAPSLDVATPPWEPMPALPDETTVVQAAGLAADPAWQHAASAFRDAALVSQDDTLAVQDVDLALREFFSAFHDVGLVFRSDSAYPRDATSYPQGYTSGPQDEISFPQGDTAYPHDDTSVLDERILPMVDITSEALNSHWAFWDGDVTEDDVMTNLTVWDAQTNSGDALTILENTASAFGGVAAVSTPTYRFDAVNSIFGAANSTFGLSNSTFGTSNSTFEGTDTTSAGATSTSHGDGWVGLSVTNHQDLDVDVSVVSTSTWDTSVSAAWDALHGDGWRGDRTSLVRTSGTSSLVDSSSSSLANFSSSNSAASSSSLSSTGSSAPSYASSSSSSYVECGSSSFSSSNSSLDDSAFISCL